MLRELIKKRVEEKMVPFSSIEMKHRIENLKQKMDSQSVDCVLAVSYHHSFYLSGAPIFPFGRPVVTIIPRNGEAAIIEGDLERAHTERQTWIQDLRVYWDEKRPPWESALLLTKDFLLERGLENARLGIEEEEMPISYLQYLKKFLPRANFVEFSDVLNSMRLVKSEEELNLIRMASDVVDLGMEKLLAVIREGETAEAIRRTVCDEMTTYALRKYPDAPFLVLGGTGIKQVEKGCGHSPGWITHGTTQKVLKGLNYGGLDAWVWGYWGNVERNMIVTDASTSVMNDFKVMIEMHEAAIAAAMPGKRIAEIDRAAKLVLHKHGYPTRQYGSGCARGLAVYGTGLTGGRELKLDLRSYNEGLLEAGMIFSVEPELKTDAGTLRHSTTVLVTKNGNEVWSRIPRGLIIV